MREKEPMGGTWIETRNVCVTIATELSLACSHGEMIFVRWSFKLFITLLGMAWKMNAALALA